LAARHHHPNARIIAFEPLSTAASIYRKVFVGDSRTTLHEAAVSTKSGVAAIQISRREDSSSLLPITSLQTELYPTVVAIGTTDVKTGPLGQFMTASDIVAPAMLKIDVQGFELEVLKASEHLLPRFDSIYVEASFAILYAGQALAYEIVEYLAKHDLHFAGAYNPTYHPRTHKLLQADLLFERDPAHG
jgi:FkbM family methyltransferase